MPIQWNRIKKNKPAIFDWLVFTISLSLGFVFTSLNDLAASPLFSTWMLASLVLYVVGVLLKRRPLYDRLAISGSDQKKTPHFLLLIIGHWIIMLCVVIFAEEAFRKIMGMPQINKVDPISGIQVFTSIVTAAFITWLVFRSGGKNKPLSKSHLFYQELVADVILIAGVAMLSFVFWEKGILEAMGFFPLNSIANLFFLFNLLSFAFILFYLPLRYLYVIEDHYNQQAWKRLSMIFLLLLLRGLFKLLNF